MTAAKTHPAQREAQGNPRVDKNLALGLQKGYTKPLWRKLPEFAERQKRSPELIKYDKSMNLKFPILPKLLTEHDKEQKREPELPDIKA